MTPEFEARFLSIDVDAITARLRDREATCTMPRTLMRRVVLKSQDISDRGGWLRLREQCDKTLLTYKQVNEVFSARSAPVRLVAALKDWSRCDTPKPA